ncbi:metal cation symporter ZIP8 [Megalops cyprinoides]|uniref:metal cation symporter ZIP8 n=1 Tax=Megalops cyprinoides TaxID=118141 RepID=UPI001863CC22|nr:metal cation symporter ZIP8 [Megalops cyprinoides]
MSNLSRRVLNGTLFVIAVSVLFTPVASEKGSDFLQDIFRFYGENDTLSFENLENMLDLLGTRRPSHVLEGENQFVHSKCLSAPEILSQYGLGNYSQASAEHLKSICPALLSHAVLPACPRTVPATIQTIDYHVWGYGVLAVTIINLSAMLGLALIPFTKKPYFPKVLTYFIGLAIGTLFSNAVLQLIPEALGFDPKADNYVLKAIGIFGGFYLLFFTEKVLKMVLKTEFEHGHSHFSPGEQSRVNSLQNGDLGVKGEVIAVTSFSNIGADPPASMNSDLASEQEAHVSRGTCHWLRGERISNIKTVAWMISLSDALHNFIDGLAIGASFTVSVLTGFSTSIAIICEEFPHELGDFVILLNAGMSIPQAVFFNLLSAMSCYIGLVLGILVGSSFAPNIIFALAGGMFLYIALADMFPEMNSILSEQEKTTRNSVVFFLIQNAGLLTGFSIILLITMFAGDINLG